MDVAFNFSAFRRIGMLCLVVFAVVFNVNSQAFGQQTPVIPNFWDPQERFIKPNVKTLPRLRFLTTTDFPPFSFIDSEKRLTGFHVDLARAICVELEVMPVCQIQAVPFAQLQSELINGSGEAIIAGLSINENTRQQLHFTRPYFKLPARFIAKRGSGLNEPLWQSLSGRDVGVVDGTAHAAMAAQHFGDLHIRVFETQQAALGALQKGDIETFFGDALSLSFWLQNQSPEKVCCEFIGRAYLSTDYLGKGLAIALTQNNRELVEAINFALKSINDKGVFAELYLRYFPISLF